MDLEHWPVPPGVHRLTAAWFDPCVEVDEDELLDFAPLMGVSRGRDARLPFQRTLDRCAGIVATHELIADGTDADSIRFHVFRGELVRLRKGWFAHPAVSPAAMLAWRIGGPLACVSALVHYELLNREDLEPDGERPHVSLRTNTSRRPGPLTIASYPGGSEASSPVLHWSTAAFRSGDRLAVSVDAALEQARHCRPVLARRAREHAARRRGALSGSAPPSASR